MNPDIKIGKGMISLFMGNITEAKIDAIVNAANTSLLGGGGVDGAIHKAGGPAILEACRAIRAKQGGCKTGEAVITPGGVLPAKFVIHTVGPVWNGGEKNEEELLANCYRNSIRLAVENDLSSIAFPSISTGAYRYPIEKASRVAIKTIAEELKELDQALRVSIFCFSSKDLRAYEELPEFKNPQV